MSPEDFSVRLIKLIGDESKASFAKRCGFSVGALSNYLGGSMPSADKALKIAQICGVKIEWLITGEESEKAASPAAQSYFDSEQDFIKIARYNARLAAGDGAFNERAELLDYIPFTKEFLLRKLGLMSEKDLAILEIEGDSMEPTISDGDLVIVDQSHRTLTDGIMAFILDDIAYIKRMRRFFDGIEIISDNKEIYPPIQLGRDRFEELHIIGRVRWCGHVM